MNGATTALSAGTDLFIGRLSSNTQAGRARRAALRAADELSVGKGQGPVHHFHAWWRRDETQR